MKKSFLCALSLVLLVGCVRQSDLDSWVGAPVGALDTHSLFMTMPMVRTITSEGIEIRDYVNQKAVSQCAGYGQGQQNGALLGNQLLSSANFAQFQGCSFEIVGCHNIFYIKNKKVIEYAPTGHCYTNGRTRPEARYMNIMGARK